VSPQARSVRGRKKPLGKGLETRYLRGLTRELQGLVEDNSGQLGPDSLPRGPAPLRNPGGNVELSHAYLRRDPLDLARIEGARAKVLS
jgi:hypothetical protein